MKLKVTTKSGSVYIFDASTMGWSRQNDNDEANVFMPGPSIEGELYEWPVLEIGKPLFALVSVSSHALGFAKTTLRSTPVVSIEEVK